MRLVLSLVLAPALAVTGFLLPSLPQVCSGLGGEAVAHDFLSSWSSSSPYTCCVSGFIAL